MDLQCLDKRKDIKMCKKKCVCVRVLACVCMYVWYVRARVRVRARARARARARVPAHECVRVLLHWSYVLRQ